jgi:hypothetical protein
VRDPRRRIIKRRLTGPPQHFRAKIGLRLQLPLLAKHDENSLARVGKNPALDQIEQPFSEARRQIGVKA